MRHNSGGSASTDHATSPSSSLPPPPSPPSPQQPPNATATLGPNESSTLVGQHSTDKSVTDRRNPSSASDSGSGTDQGEHHVAKSSRGAMATAGARAPLTAASMAAAAPGKSKVGDEATAASSSTDAGEAPAAAAAAASPPKSAWQRLKASLHGSTRAGRREAHDAIMEAERRRLLEMDPRPFKHRPLELAELVDPKNVEMLQEMGGTRGLLDALGTDGAHGLDAPIGGASADDAAAAGQQPPHSPEAEREAKLEEGATTQEKSHDWVEASMEQRERVYGTNSLPKKKSKSLLLLMWLALQDKMLILLCIAAVISLALGLYTDLGTPPERVPCLNPDPGAEDCAVPQVDWVEGLAILVAVAVVDIIGSVNDYQKELQFKKLNEKKDERNVKVIRRGRPALMSVNDVRVGDVLQLEPGEIIPADGVFLRGHNVRCDESGATGESDMIKKVSYEEALEAHREGRKHVDCFLLSGSKVLEGQGEYVVIATGTFSFNGKLMLSLRTEAEETPLQGKLNRLAELIAYFGSSAGILLFVVLFIRFLVRLGTEDATPNQRGQDFIQILIISVTIIVVAVPEGLPLAVTLALAFATKRMTAQNLLVRLLGSCETMANATVICTDKTGTLTQNDMSVVAGCVGVNLKFAYNLAENGGRVEKDEQGRFANGDRAVDQAQLGDHVVGEVRTLLNDAIAVNSTAFEEDDEAAAAAEASASSKGVLSTLRKLPVLGSLVPKKKLDAAKAKALRKAGFVGSKTETALLKMAKELGWEDYRAARERNTVVHSVPFSSERKAMGVVAKRADGGYRFFVKGASEILTKLCTRHIDVGGDAGGEGAVVVHDFGEAARANVERTIFFYANQTLRTIALCYRDFESWPPRDAELDEQGEVVWSSLAKELTLLGIVGIEDPLRPGVRDAVAKCRMAGCTTVMVTGDNVLTARSIAAQCGIFTPGGVIMEGPVFRRLGEADLAEVVPRLQVLARSSPEDKKRLVTYHKKMGNIVAVTGDGTNDGPALKTANVGFAMGIAGTEVAKEASDIVVMDDNFGSIVAAIMWGRCVNDAVRKFLQFQLSVNIGACLITFISAVSSAEESSVLTAVQLLWINLLMDSLAALALASDPAHPRLLDRKPDRTGGVLITLDMWKMIVGQAAYQVALILVLNFAGIHILGRDGYPEGSAEERQARGELLTLIFNAFVWCQLFNQVNCRELGRELNFFRGVHRNPWFIGILAIEVGFQVLIVFVGKSVFSVQPIPASYWGISIIAGLVSWPLGVLIRMVPNAPLERALIHLHILPDPNRLPTVSASAAVDRSAELEKIRNYNEPALGHVAEKLNFFAAIRGGRSKLANLRWKSRSRLMREADVHPQSLMALVPALLAVAPVGQWQPQNPAGSTLADPATAEPTASTVQLSRDAFQIHPDTPADDAFRQRVEARLGAAGAAAAAAGRRAGGDADVEKPRKA